MRPFLRLILDALDSLAAAMWARPHCQPDAHARIEYLTTNAARDGSTSGRPTHKERQAPHERTGF